ncbi:hypothetical protein IW146_007306 [Coemansia sp. RSA 922]|nr:hypothetical protein H4S03_002747 [Coemansia sp. S3946]KAJ2049378.1 hypothetical protein H4S04_003266 [Coemansia sp. S16]KAJ2054845.1 hypothetical protein GGI08_004389 [Coemansia sp. S2]KAJ2064525.1 hypothetical protein GGH13_006146 [Coemansia sp. S155-1]KAJ2107463.1 hypothetical protein IW146_007306 [Coemansia sp. RSA 922]
MGIRQYAYYIRPMWCSRPHVTDQPDSSPFHLAKELVIELDMWSVCTDEGLESLSRVALGDGAFPMVRSVKFLFDEFQEGEDLLTVPPNAPANAVAFAKRILQMAPKASEIEMVTDVLSDESSNDSSDDFPVHFSDLLAQLLQLATRVRCFSEGSHITINRQTALVRNLVYLSYEVDRDGINFVQLARQCAPTLQSLSMSSIRYSDIVDLIQDCNGDFMVYPQLLLLEHSVYAGFELSEMPVNRGATPFPRLKRLIFQASYPFGDDTPFRGNAGTLETLSFILDHQTLAILDRHRVFTPTSHPKLRYVDTSLSDGDQPEHASTSTNLLRLALRIGPFAQVRKIDDLKNDDPAWMCMLQLIGTMNSIQILVLPKIRLALWDAITLVKALPVLSDLHTSTPCLGSIPAGIDLALLPDHVILKYVPIGKRFRCWRIVEVMSEGFVDAVHCVLLMALLCPNFDYVAPPGVNHQLFMAKLDEIMHTDGYKQYSTRLQRLLFTS